MTEKPRLNLAGALSLAVVAYLLVLAGGMLIVGTPAWSPFEDHAVVAVNALHSPVLDIIAHTLNIAFGSIGAMILTLALAVGAGIRFRSWATSVRVMTLIVVPWALSYMLKIIVGRPRPSPAGLTHDTGVDPSTLSYPSGHTAFAAAIMVTLVLLVIHGRRGLRMPLIAAAIVVVLVAGWSRIYLGVHYPTDILASIVLVPATVIAANRVITGVTGSPLIRQPETTTEEAVPPAPPSPATHSLLS